MKIWLTPHFSDEAPKEVNTLSEPVGDSFCYIEAGYIFGHTHYGKEGECWHRDRDSAIVAAKRHREDRIKKSAKEIARLIDLPALV